METISENSIEAVLQVLLFMVFADRKAHEEEYAMARKAIPNLSIFTENKIDVPEEGLDNLIVRQAARVRALMDESDLTGAIDTALRRITNPMLAMLTLKAMNEIASSDSDIHISETDLIEKAEAIWN